MILDLLSQTNDWNATVYLNPVNTRKIERFGSAYILNIIIKLHNDSWLDLSVKLMKKTLKDIFI